ncbi:MAG TPA: cytochrome P450 [Acidimicrobiales bacterium]|nr:cytochrome P450 [Acidimicrobiales bacterium]
MGSEENSLFDHNSSAFANGWRSQLAAIRAKHGLTRSDAHGGFVVLGRRGDVQRALRDQKTFVSTRWFDPEASPGGRTEGGVTIPPNPARMGMMEMEPPESVFYRRLLNPWFTRGAIQSYRPRIREIVSWCIDGVIGMGKCDVVDDLANPIPALVSLDFLGLPLDRWERYAAFVHAAGYRRPGSGKGIRWVLDDLRDTVETGTFHKGGVIDALKAELPDDMVIELSYMLLNGGMDTTTSMIAGMTAYLQSAPAGRQRLSEDPSRLPAAVQELVRWCAPSTGVARTVVQEVEIAGETVHPGERVLLALGSANLDEEAFSNAEQVQLDRSPNPHLSFGTGAHKCIGADLSTAELEVYLEEVLRRLPDLDVDLDRSPRYPVMPLVNGFITMPATFTPGRVESVIRRRVPELRNPRLQPVARSLMAEE